MLKGCFIFLEFDKISGYTHIVEVYSLLNYLEYSL